MTTIKKYFEWRVVSTDGLIKNPWIPNDNPERDVNLNMETYTRGFDSEEQAINRLSEVAEDYHVASSCEDLVLMSFYKIQK